MAWKGAKIGVGYRIDIPPSECEIELSTGLPPHVKDRHGTRQGRLTAEEFAGFQISVNNKKIAIWQCVCDCGKRINVLMGPSKRRAQSCGCLHSEYHTHHGASGDNASWAERKAHRAWFSLLKQSSNSSKFSFPSPIGREIKMHAPWLEDFHSFLKDMGLPPTPDHVLSRIDYNKDFEPKNLRWIHKKENSQKVFSHINQFKKSPLIMSYKDELIKLIEKYPDATAAEYCKLIADATGVQTSKTTMYKNLHDLGKGMVRKKNRWPPYNDELIELVKKYPNATAKRHRELLANVTGVQVSESAIHRNLGNLRKRGLVIVPNKIRMSLYKDELIKLVEDYPDVTAAEYCKLFAEATGIRVSESAVYRNIKKLGLSQP
jgi:transposase